MFVHNVFFKWKPGTTTSHVDEMAAALGTLPGKVRELDVPMFRFSVRRVAKSG